MCCSLITISKQIRTKPLFLLSCKYRRYLRNLGQELPELGPLIEDVLRENNVEIQSKAPSSVDMMSSRGSISVKSGGSAISRSSKMSKK